ncbi:MAG: flagellar biosynthesis protein FlhA [Oligoflexales bacterium]|nr:flagellar biosynthesis protein FlhA [Oligoflexales bacterium]
MAVGQANNSPNAILGMLKSPDVQFALALICIIFMLFIPLPPLLLDVLLSLSITIGFLVLLIAIYIKEPLDFSTFPTFLLLATLFRLALNVATTRNILLEGASGEVSHVISSFGNFVVGGNYFVGFVIFLILVIINFLVITKGAGRVAEVGARFTLDAMPGKQMSIDADLNAGVIDREEAKKRRTKIEEEADFYGAMDGASKFVRGDAIAGIVITGINILVGLALGVLQHDMTFARASQVYTLLTVGDGLVSQIPSIIISVAAGIVVTRASGDSRLSSDLSDQLILHPIALYICSGLLILMSMMPGLPTISFLALAVLFYIFGNYANKEHERRHLAEVAKSEAKNRSEHKPDSIENLLHVDTLALEVGVGLIPLVDADQDGEILERIVSSRKQFAQDMGIIVPMVMVRDNIQLKPGEYQVLLKGQPIAKGSLLVEHELAMAPEDAFETIDGLKTKEPAYGLDAYWIKPSQRDEVTFKGYTVVNCSTVIVTHLTKVIQDHAHELIGRQETQSLIDGLKDKAPKVVEEVISAEGVNLGTIVKILQNLLKEGVSIRDMLSIFESVADHCKQVKNADILTRFARKALGRGIVRKYLGDQDTLFITTLDRAVEDLLVSSIQQHENGSTSLNIEPTLAQKLLNRIAESMGQFERTGTIPLLLCGAQLRWDLKKLIERFIPGLTVLAFDEVPSDIKTNSLMTINLE